MRGSNDTWLARTRFSHLQMDFSSIIVVAIVFYAVNVIQTEIRSKHSLGVWDGDLGH